MMPQQHDLEVPRKIDDEHAQLRETLASIQCALASRRVNHEALSGMFGDLARNVLLHFEHEEHGGYFAEAIELAPRLSQRADDLLKQHSGMAAQLLSLRLLAEKCGADDRWLARVDEKFTEFLNRFRAHEAAENQLLQEAYGEDIGTED